MDFSKFTASQAATVKKQLAGMEVGVLINNVGISYEFAQWFHELTDAEVLYRPVETIKRMRPLGKPLPAVGDAVLGMPTLVHRGPGHEVLDGPPRRVLFFTLRPTFHGERADGAAGIGRTHTGTRVPRGAARCAERAHMAPGIEWKSLSSRMSSSDAR